MPRGYDKSGEPATSQRQQQAATYQHYEQPVYQSAPFNPPPAKRHKPNPAGEQPAYAPAPAAAQPAAYYDPATYQQWLAAYGYSAEQQAAAMQQYYVQHGYAPPYAAPNGTATPQAQPAMPSYPIPDPKQQHPAAKPAAMPAPARPAKRKSPGRRSGKSSTQSPPDLVHSSPAEAAANRANIKPPRHAPPARPTPGWYPTFTAEELRNTPSQRRGMSPREERAERGEGMRFIVRAGRKMRLPTEALVHAGHYFHRFYMKHSFFEFEKRLTAGGCLYLASKTCECRKRAKDVMAQCHRTEHNRDPPNPHDGYEASRAHDQLVDRVLDLELVLLQSIGFALRVDTPYNYLALIFRFLGEKYRIDELRIRHYARWAWRFVLGAYETVVALISTPQQIAVACAELAIRFENLRCELQHDRDEILRPTNPSDWHTELRGLDTPPQIINMLVNEISVCISMEDQDVINPPAHRDPKVMGRLRRPRQPAKLISGNGKW